MTVLLVGGNEMIYSHRMGIMHIMLTDSRSPVFGSLLSDAVRAELSVNANYMSTFVNKLMGRRTSISCL